MLSACLSRSTKPPLPLGVLGEGRGRF
jgi:hypothetical protein